MLRIIHVLLGVAVAGSVAGTALLRGGAKAAEPEAGASKKVETSLTIDSVFGRGFGQVFKQEVLLEKGSYPPRTMAAESGEPFWTARVSGSEKKERVSGHTSTQQKEIQEWAMAHPKEAVTVVAYETIEAGGVPSLTAEVKISEFPAWQDSGWVANPRLIVTGLVK